MNLRESRRLNGREVIYEDHGRRVEVRDWWSWSFSRVRDDVIRGALAEFIVWSLVDADGIDLGSPARPYDFELAPEPKVKVEVKSCSEWQDWVTTRPRPVSWTITKRQNTIEGRHPQQQWHADIFVFAALRPDDPDTSYPLEIEQWRFHVLTRARLEEAERSGKLRTSSNGGMTLRPQALADLDVTEVRWDELREAVRAAELSVRGGSQ